MGLNHLARFEHAGASLVDEVLGDSASHHIVFMHGWGGDRNSLRAIGVLFRPTHAVHLLDLPGFGKSPRLLRRHHPQLLRRREDRKALD